MSDTRPRDHLTPVPTTTSGDPPLRDHTAEQLTLGAAITSPTTRATILDLLAPADFYDPAHELIYDALLHLHHTGAPLDPFTLHHHLRTSGAHHGGLGYLHTLVTGAVPELGPQYAAVVADLAHRRAWAATATRIHALAANPTTTHLAATALADATRTHGHTTPTTDHITPAADVDDFLAATPEDRPYDWVIPGLIERRDRVILTGAEGSGKSTLARQIATQTAAGIHPFTGEPITPMRVTIIDLENGDDQVRRELRPLRLAASTHLAPGHLRVETRIDGLNLAAHEDRAWLHAKLTAAPPDLLILGPIYKMVTEGNPNDEQDTKPVALYLDTLRADLGCALWLEAHVGNETTGTNRPKRPVGWSGWRRWPEFGLFLDRDGALTPWRGARDATRDWPTLLTRGGPWPFTTATDENAHRWHTIAQCIRNAGERLSERDIAKLTGIPRSTVQRVLGAYAMQHTALLYSLHGDTDDDA